MTQDNTFGDGIDEMKLIQEQGKRAFEDIGGADPRRYKILIAVLGQLFTALEAAKWALPLDDSDLAEFITAAKTLNTFASSRAVPTFSGSSAESVGGIAGGWFRPRVGDGRKAVVGSGDRGLIAAPWTPLAFP